MALIPYQPFRQLENWRRDMNKFFNEPISYVLGEEFNLPRIDVYETAGEVVVSCELPGLEKKEDVDIDLRDNLLVIAGNINRVQEVKEEQLLRQERFFGRFQRSICLPAQVSTENAKATYKNGILEIRLPKVKGAVKNNIDIQFQ